MNNTADKNQHQLTSQVKLLQKVVLVHQGEFLILKRGESAHNRPGAWDLPGGNSEWPVVSKSRFGLHRDDAAREVREETGVELGGEAFGADAFGADSLSYLETFFDVSQQVYSVIVGWRVDLPEDFDRNSIQLSHEHSEFTWVKTADLDQYNFGGSAGQFVEDIIQGRGQSGIAPRG